ncbi:MAG: hypothetical protein E6G00_03920 [Actinobacteria bacterium]|nr:MAG: hypothetical protein E6G00_03920 [Actinomycetota bacterium]
MHRAGKRTGGAAVAVCLAVAALVALVPGASAGGGRVHAARTHVLLVGTWRGRKGSFKSIQAAVNAAKPGDWILVGPGDYHERADHRRSGRPSSDDSGGGVYITKSRIHLRGMNRNAVFVDGTKPGPKRCPSKPRRQDLGPRGKNKKPLGRNGVEVFKANGVSVENLTACNFLDGSGGGGNQIWFNGGDGSGKIGMGAFRGAYLSATTTYWKRDAPAGSYGIFSSNSRGPGIFTHDYASNMDDSSFYVGACRPDCNQVVDHVHAQGSTLGLSSTNVGGHLIIQNSEWDRNKTGMVTNSQNNDDAPEPQDGSCPVIGGGSPAPGGAGSCTIWRNNYVHNNNNAHVPASGTAGEGPVGTGMVIAGGRFDTVKHNRVESNGAWPRRREPPAGGPLPRRHRDDDPGRPDRVLLRRLGQRDRLEQAEGQRVLRQPHQRRPGGDQQRREPGELLARQHRPGGRDERSGAHPDDSWNLRQAELGRAAHEPAGGAGRVCDGVRREPRIGLPAVPGGRYWLPAAGQRGQPHPAAA